MHVMAKLTLEVCSCCGIKEAYIAEAMERIKAEHGENIEIIPRKCLDVCAEFGAVKFAGEVMAVRPEDLPGLEAKIRAAAAE